MPLQKDDTSKESIIHVSLKGQEFPGRSPFLKLIKTVRRELPIDPHFTVFHISHNNMEVFKHYIATRDPGVYYSIYTKGLHITINGLAVWTNPNNPDMSDNRIIMAKRETSRYGEQTWVHNRIIAVGHLNPQYLSTFRKTRKLKL